MSQPKPLTDPSPDPQIQPAPAEGARVDPIDEAAPEFSTAARQTIDESPTAEPGEPSAGDAPADVVLETYALHPAAPRLWAWQVAIPIFLPTVPLSIVGAVWQGPWAVVAILLLAVLAWRIASRHLRLAVARFRCERFARGLRYRHGVWWQSEVFIPSERVQHTEVNQGPIARRFGIGKLKVFTAAVQLGALEIDGLAYEDAVLLRDRLLGRAGDPFIDAPKAEAPPVDVDG